MTTKFKLGAINKYPAYFKYKGIRGTRFWKYLSDSKAIQVTLDAGEEKAGRPAIVGIYTVKPINVMANYGFHKEFTESSLKEFSEAFGVCLKKMQIQV